MSASGIESDLHMTGYCLPSPATEPSQCCWLTFSVRPCRLLLSQENNYSPAITAGLQLQYAAVQSQLCNYNHYNNTAATDVMVTFILPMRVA